jgi:hypothetical protein
MGCSRGTAQIRLFQQPRLRPDPRENLIHDAFKRRGGVDYDTTLREVFFRGMQSHNQLAFARSSAKLIFGSPGKPPVQRIEIDLENEDPVKQINEAGEISRAAAEEGDRVALIGDHRFDFVHIPDVMLVPPCDAVRHALMGKPIHRFPRLWIALISQLAVTVDGVVTAPPQFLAD